MTTTPFVRYVVTGAVRPDEYDTEQCGSPPQHVRLVRGPGRYPSLPGATPALINAKYMERRRSRFLLGAAAGTIPVGGDDPAKALVHAEEAVRDGIPVLVMPGKGRLYWNPSAPSRPARHEPGVSHLVGHGDADPDRGAGRHRGHLATNEVPAPPSTRFAARPSSASPPRNRSTPTVTTTANTERMMKEVEAMLERAYEIRAECSGRGGRRRAPEINQGVRDPERSH